MNSARHARPGRRRDLHPGPGRHTRPDRRPHPAAGRRYRRELVENCGSYAGDMKDTLDARAPESFSPAVSMLDRLVESIAIRR
jgi:hypothetical protein